MENNGILGGKKYFLDFSGSIGLGNRRKRLTTQPITLFQEYLRNASMLPEVSVHIGRDGDFSRKKVPGFAVESRAGLRKIAGVRKIAGTLTDTLKVHGKQRR